MITETMPLNEWPIESLKNLEKLIVLGYVNSESTIISDFYYNLFPVVKKAIKDVEFEQSKS